MSEVLVQSQRPKYDRILDLHAQGLSADQIAAALGDGTKTPNIRTVISKARLAQDPRAHYHYRKQVTKSKYFVDAAEARGIPVRELISRLLGVIEKDQMVDAILDDKE